MAGIGCTRFHLALGAAAPVADVAVGVATWVVMASRGDQPLVSWWNIGFAPQDFALLCVIKFAWLALLASLVLLGDSAISAGRQRIQKLLEGTFSYVFVSYLVIACITHFVADPPDGMQPSDDTALYLGFFGTSLCTYFETYWTPGFINALRESASARAARLAAASSSPEDGAYTMVDLTGGQALLGSRAGAASSNAPSASSAPQKPPTQEESKAVGLRQFWSLISADWKLMVMASVWLFGAAVLEAMIPYNISAAVSGIIRAQQNGTLTPEEFRASFEPPVLKLVALAAGDALLSAFRGGTFIMIGSRASSRLRSEMLTNLLKQEIGYFDATSTGELSSRLTQDCQKVTDQITNNINVFLRNLVSTVTTLIFMWAQDPELTLLAFVSVPAIVQISKTYGGIMWGLSMATQGALAEANGVAEEALGTMSTVRMFAAERLELERFQHKLDKFLQIAWKTAMFYMLYISSTILLPNVVTAIVLYKGGKLCGSADLQGEVLVAFVLYVQQLNGNFGAMGGFYSNMVQALGSGARVFELKSRQSKLPTDKPDGQDDPQGIRGELLFRNVVFSYPTRPDTQVLKGLDLDINAGQVVALVGPSGNGKSTVIGLLKRLYKEDSGSVTLDGRNLWKFEHHAYHKVVSIVGQEPVLYRRTIKENILYGITNPGDFPQPRDYQVDHSLEDTAWIEECCKKANAHEFILSMKEGYAMQVGARGSGLSGGQKQRIAIARALIRRPSVLLLDEATSALDTESEALVQKSIDNMINEGNMTVVIIAHRLSTVRNAHKICVIKEGKVVEEGRHEELVANGRDYFNLVQTQLSAIANPQGEEAPK